MLRGLELPERGEDPSAIVDFILKHIMPFPMGNDHPRFFGWVVGAPAPVGVLAETLAATINSSCGGAEHAAIPLEACVSRWLMELVVFPVEGSRGLLVSGGSVATLTALGTARHWAAARAGIDVRAAGLQAGHAPLVLYTSVESHHCVARAAEVLGLGTDNIRLIPADAAFRMRVDLLAEAIAADRAAGKQPFCIVGTAGTTSTGAVDPLGALADLAAREGLWFHVDGAYGGFGVLDPALTEIFKGMERADSIAIDPHKWLGVPIESGFVMVRDGALQRRAFSHSAAYLRDGGNPDDDPWPMEYGIQLTRGFRALKTWATLQHMGRAGAAAIITHHNRLARRLANAIETAPDVELLAPVTLSTVCFRCNPGGRDEAALERLNQAVNDHVNATGEVFVTPTRLNGLFSLRATFLHPETTAGDADHLLGCVRRAAADVSNTG